MPNIVMLLWTLHVFRGIPKGFTTDYTKAWILCGVPPTAPATCSAQFPPKPVQIGCEYGPGPSLTRLFLNAWTALVQLDNLTACVASRSVFSAVSSAVSIPVFSAVSIG